MMTIIELIICMSKNYAIVRQDKKCRNKLRFKKRNGNRKSDIINQHP
jgi:hypothetical protein